MAIPGLSITKLYNDGTKLSEAQLDAVKTSIESWASQVVARAPDKTSTESVSGTWTFSNLVASSGITDTSGNLWAFPTTIGTDTFVGRTTAQTLTNKTLTSPTITGGTIGPASLNNVSASNVTIGTNFTSADSSTTPDSRFDVYQYTRGPVAHCLVTVSGGTPTLSTRYNVTSVGDTGAGDFLITFSRAMLDTAFGVTVTCADNGADPIIGSYDSSTKSTTTVRITCRLKSTGALTDPTEFMVAIYGSLS
jgi:hypothetical protein